MGGDLMQRMFGRPAAEEIDEVYLQGRSEHSAAEMKAGYESMKKQDRAELALEDLAAATAQGYAGPASDGLLESRPWGFPLASPVPLRIWHGGADDDVPVEAGRYLAKHCLGLDVAGPSEEPHVAAGGKYFEVETENHTLIRRRWKAILDETLAAAAAP
jgi:hypothetical protein